MKRIGLLAFLIVLAATDAKADPPLVGFAPGIAVNPTVSGVTSLTAGSSSQIFGAGNRNAYRIANTTASSGGDVLCTDDGSTPSSTNYSFRVYATTVDLEALPNPLSNQALNCTCSTGNCTIKAEQY